MDELQPWIDDVLDFIEFANGSPETTWGRVRAELGREEPFGLKYVCLGNEEHDSPEFRERFPHFVRAIRAKYPGIKIIGTSGLGPQIPLYDFMHEHGVEVSDEHYYEPPDWFIRNRDRFDDFDRDKPEIYIGEYAANGNTLFHAVAEAVFLTGVERNADLVTMTSYAPTYARYDFTQWIVNMIFFDHKTVVLTPNYHVQHLFSVNKGDRYLQNEVAYTVRHGAGHGAASGTFGIGTWGTQAEFADIRVASGDQVLFEERFDQPAAGGWKPLRGTFEQRDGVYAQSSGDEPAISLFAEPVETGRMVYTLRARKTGGREGFLVVFGNKGDQGRHYWWNIGGWNNSLHGIARGHGGVLGGKAELETKPGRIETGAWYDIRIEVDGERIRCFLNGELIHDVTDVDDTPVLAVSSAEDLQSNEIILKIANSMEAALSTRINLHGVAAVHPEASVVTLTGNPGDINDLENPERVRPVDGTLEVSTGFDCTIPASSVQIIRIRKAE